jgi:hypothetical protein
MMQKSSRLQAYENVKDQLGYCGIWCGSCVVGNGTFIELTKRYQDLIGAYDLLEWGPRDFDHGEFSKGLESFQKVSSCLGCLKGGGRDHCEIRDCASERELQHCISCDEFTNCPHAHILQHMRQGALGAGLFVKTEAGDRNEWLKKHTIKLMGKWPCSIMFLDDQ